MYGLHDGDLTFLTLSVISVKRYPTIQNATLMITKRILRLMAFLWLLVFVLVTLRFWDTKAVFFRPVLMALTVLCTCMNVSCYGKVFLLFRRYRQELFSHVQQENKTSRSVGTSNSQPMKGEYSWQYTRKLLSPCSTSCRLSFCAICPPLLTKSRQPLSDLVKPIRQWE